MKIIGYCTVCRKIKYVTWDKHLPIGNVYQGICTECEKKEEDERKKGST